MQLPRIETYCSYRVVASTYNNFIDTWDGVDRFVCKDEDIKISMSYLPQDQNFICSKSIHGEEQTVWFGISVYNPSKGKEHAAGVYAGTNHEYLDVHHVSKDFSYVRIYRGKDLDSNTGLEAVGKGSFDDV